MASKSVLMTALWSNDCGGLAASQAAAEIGKSSGRLPHGCGGS